jgi:hypothetical protein
MQNAECKMQNIRTFYVLCSLFYALGSLLSTGCALIKPKPRPLLRPGCAFRVVDDMSSLPIPGVHVTVLTLFSGRDTIGTWSALTDAEGIAEFSSVGINPLDSKARQQAGHYDFIVVFERAGFRYYSQRITAQSHRIILSREYLIAGTPETLGAAG